MGQPTGVIEELPHGRKELDAIGDSGRGLGETRRLAACDESRPW